MLARDATLSAHRGLHLADLYQRNDLGRWRGLDGPLRIPADAPRSLTAAVR
jgi:hypothetical protein